MRGLIMAAQQQKRAVGLLLDQYPTTGFAYTYAREIISGQGNIIEAVRPDNSFSLFSSNNIVDGTLEAFADGGDVKIRKWLSLQGAYYSELHREGDYQVTQPNLVLGGSTIKGVNNIPVVNFIPSDAILESDLGANNFSNDNFTWYLIYQSQPTSTRNIVISESVPSLNFNGNYILSSSLNQELYVYRPQLTTFRALRNITIYEANRIEQICVRRTGDLLEVFVDNVKENEVEVDQLFIEDTKLYMGTRAIYPNSTFNGGIFETIMYRESHSNQVINIISEDQMAYYL